MMKKLICTVFFLGFLTACGGGGGGQNTQVIPPPDQCSVPLQNQSLLDYLQDHYYWYQDIPANLDAAGFASLDALLDAARAADDRFSFIISRARFDEIFTEANFVGLGFSHRVSADEQVLEVRYVYDNGAAMAAGMARGDHITAVNGVDSAVFIGEIKAGVKTWDDVFGDREVGVSVSISFDKPSGEVISVELGKDIVDTNTVLASQVIPTLNKQVGYLVFDQFIERSKEDLNQAFSQFVGAGVNELVLDLRYNGGGLVNVANQLSTQVGGSHVSGQVFTRIIHNDKQSSRNSTQLFGLGEGIDQLGLDRLIVLTSSETCSASELVINSLSPFIDVVIVGDDSCGKPVGMNPAQLCDNMIFAINFETVNALGVGGYFDGLAVDCFAGDLIVGDWGDINDPLLKEGLYYIDNDQCFGQGLSPLRAVKQSPLNQIDYSKGPREAKKIR